jgi:methylmalonyl-CoA mutase N-terminal domain/subunit
MEGKKNIYDKWSEKIITDLGKNAYYELFSFSNEDIAISPHYTYNKDSLINPDKLLFPKTWDIMGEIDCSKTTDLNKEIKKLYGNDIKNLTLYNYKNEALDKSIISRGNLFICSNKFIQNSELNILIEPKLDSLNDLNLNDYISEKFKLNISSEFFKNSGANIVQEIAFTISVASELLNRYGVNLIEKISFELIQGNNYFFEIAKIQVLRILWSIVSKEYGKQIDDCVIIAKPSIKNKTIKNYNNNIIRSTTECMSGILGGCNFIKSIPYDFKFKDSNDFSERIKYNQLLILKNETSIDKVNNAVSGSYYITYLIENLAQKSLDLFKKITTNGGYSISLKNDGLFNDILSNSKKEEEQFNSGEKILVGFNKYLDE